MFIQTLGAKHQNMLTFFFSFFPQSGTSYFRLKKTARKGRVNITPQETASPLCLQNSATGVLSNMAMSPPRGEEFQRSFNHKQVPGLGTRGLTLLLQCSAELWVTGNKPSSLPGCGLLTLLFLCLNQRLPWAGSVSLNAPPLT